MNHRARILVASDNADDTKLIRSLLAAEFDNIGVCSDPDQAAQAFEAQPPAVLVLAFDTLEKSERCYLGLFRSGAAMRPHRTVILCSKDNVRQVYQLCRKEQFDDYVLFWPMNHDAHRLPMALHHALRQHAATAGGLPSAADIAAQVRRLGALDTLLDEHASGGQAVADGVRRSLDQAGAGMGGALDRFAAWIGSAEGKAIAAGGDRAAFDHAIERLKADGLDRHLQAVAASVQPVQQWAGALRQQLAPQAASVRDLRALADRVQRVALIVDDDPFQRKVLERVLRDDGFETVTAANAVEAMTLAGKRRPDIVLMDVDLPGIDGVEATRQIKSSQHLAATPVLMITGHSDKSVVVRCVQAGAAGFIVKPFNKEVLLAKVASCLNTADTSVAD